jgi:hypothetical protein
MDIFDHKKKVLAFKPWVLDIMHNHNGNLWRQLGAWSLLLSALILLPKFA